MLYLVCSQRLPHRFNPSPSAPVIGYPSRHWPPVSPPNLVHRNCNYGVRRLFFVVESVVGRESQSCFASTIYRNRTHTRFEISVPRIRFATPLVFSSLPLLISLLLSLYISNK